MLSTPARSTTGTFDLASRLKASAIHLCISAVIAALAASLVFALWYPWPYRIISGGQALFMLVLSVDLVLGPVLTFVAFNTSKTRQHLVRDLVVIAALQLGGLVYGLYTVFLARPVAVVFEVDRFRVVPAVNVYAEELPQALPELRSLSLRGPRLLGTRDSRDGDERLKTFDLALRGVDTGVRPSYWQPYEKSRAAALQRARPVSVLLKKYPAQAAAIQAEIAKTGLSAEQIKFLPVLSHKADWSALLDARNGNLVGFAPADGFF